MKKIIFTIIMSVLTLMVYSKGINVSKVPVLVRASFELSFPEAKAAKWETTEESDYKVSFRTGEDNATAYYDAQGNFIEADKTIEWKEVPLTGRMEIYHLNSARIINVIKIITAQNKIFYQVDIKKDARKQEVLLDEEGNIIKKI